MLPYKFGDLWGYADSKGNVVLEPLYAHAGLMENGRAYVQLPERAEYFLIDSLGNYLKSYSPYQFQSKGASNVEPPDLYREYLFRDSLLYSKDSDLITFLLRSPIKRDDHRGYTTFYLFSSELEKLRWKNMDYVIQNPELVRLVKIEQSWFYILDAISHQEGYIEVLYADRYQIRSKSFEDAFSMGLVSFGDPIASMRWNSRPVVPLRIKDKWCLVDPISEKRLCRPKYYAISPFLKGIACATLEKAPSFSLYEAYRPPRKFALINSKGKRISNIFKHPVENLSKGALILKKRGQEVSVYTYNGTPISKRFFHRVSLLTDWCIQAETADSFFLFRYAKGSWNLVVQDQKDRYGRGLPEVRTSFRAGPVLVMKILNTDSLQILKQQGAPTTVACNYFSNYYYMNTLGCYSYDGQLVANGKDSRPSFSSNGYYTVSGILYHIDSTKALTDKASSSSLVVPEQNHCWVRADGRWALYNLKMMTQVTEGRLTSGYAKPEHLGSGIYRLIHEGNYYYINKEGLWYWE